MELFKAICFGIVEGITEWLPVSSTGHMILLDEFIRLDVSGQFYSLFQVVIQLGAILAVVVLFWGDFFPVAGAKVTSGKSDGFRLELKICPDRVLMWGKILAACIPAAVAGVLYQETFERLFYNYQTVAAALILFGIAFLAVERRNRNRKPRAGATEEITWKMAFLIGVFQLAAAVFPGTSRSGATIVGALWIGVSKVAAAEFTFYLAIPVMFGASLLKLARFGLEFTGTELMILAAGMISAFLVSILVIRFLMNYIKKHDFAIFGWYRIALGILVLLYFGIPGR